ncbi:MAG: hypothetical protein Q4G04_06140 [bacterium]|nr:hypothetical protein [bacterium]
MTILTKITTVIFVFAIILDVYRIGIYYLIVKKSTTNLFVKFIFLLSAIVVCFKSLGHIHNSVINIPNFVISIIFIVIIIILSINDFAIKKREMTTLSIKKAIDLSKNGIMFIGSDGKRILSNSIMDKLLKELNINNNIIDKIKSKSINNENNSYIIRSNKKVWNIIINNKEIMANDVTDAFELQEKLLKNNADIKRNNDIIRKSINKIDEIEKESNMLKIKNDFHDLLGHRLSLFSKYLEMNKININEVKNIINNLFEEDENKKSKDKLIILVNLYKTLGININVIGALPLGDKVANVFYEIIREAVTNAIIHANSKNIKVVITENEYKKELVITNDGDKPKQVIYENEGIKGMRRKLKIIGGTLIIDTKQEFILKAII